MRSPALLACAAILLAGCQPTADPPQAAPEAGKTSLAQLSSAPSAPVPPVSVAEAPAANPSGSPSGGPSGSPSGGGAASAAAPAGSGPAVASPSVGGKPLGPKELVAGPKLESLPKGQAGVLTAAEADKVLGPQQKASLALLDLGTPPRAKLRYDIQKGVAYKGNLGLDTSMKVEAANNSLPEAKMPRTNLVLDISALDRNAAGEASIKGIISDISLDGAGPQLKQRSDALVLVKGLEMTYWVSPTGKTRDFAVKLPPTAPKEVGAMAAGLTASMDQIVVPFPDEDVGVGARWSTVARVSANGIDILQLTKYKLVEHTGTVIKLEVQVEQVAAKDEIVAPGMGSAKAKLLGFSSAGKGVVEADLKALGPKLSTIGLETKMDLLATQGDKTEKASMTLKVNVEFKQK